MITSRTRCRAAVVAGLAMWALSTMAALAQGGDRPVVGTTQVAGAITPVVAEHLEDMVSIAEDRGYEALVVSLDTPGGLVASMRAIVQTFLNADVPIVVHVAPSGADAGSAGTFITLAAHVAAMAPATTIGAATPVDLEGGEVGDKVVNNAAAYAEAVAEERGRDVQFAIDSVRDGRSVTADTAVEIGAVDLIASDLDDLLSEIDGRDVRIGDGTVTLATADAARAELEMSLTRRVLQQLADPNVAFLLLSLSTLAILYEIANPGVGAGGVTGAVALVLALYALSVLPVTMAGIALVVVAAALFVIEIFVPGIGVAAGGGTVALLLAGLFLFQRPSGIGLDGWVLIPTVAVTAGLATIIAVAAARTRRISARTTGDPLRGRIARLRGAGTQRPRVQIDGTWWRVRPSEDAAPTGLADGQLVRVVDRVDLDLVVEPADAADDHRARSRPTNDQGAP